MSKFKISFKTIDGLIDGLSLGIIVNIFSNMFIPNAPIWSQCLMIAILFVIILLCILIKNLHEKKQNKAVIDAYRAEGKEVTLDDINNLIHIGNRAYDPNTIPFIKRNKDYKRLRKKYDKAVSDVEKRNICDDIEALIKTLVSTGERIYQCQENNPQSKEIQQIKNAFDNGNSSKANEMIENSDDAGLHGALKGITCNTSGESYDSKQKRFHEHILSLKEKLAETCLESAGIADRYGDYNLAITRYENALHIYRELSEIDSDKYIHILAVTLRYLANSRINAHCFYQKAEEELNEAIELYGRLPEGNSFDRSLNVAENYRLKANMYDNKYSYEKAEAAFLDSLSILKDVKYDGYKEYIILQKNILKTTNHLVFHYLALENLKASKKYIDEASNIYDEVCKDNDSFYICYDFKRNEARYYYLAKEYKQSNEKSKEALKIARQMYESEHSIDNSYHLAKILELLARLHSDMGYYSQAEDEYSESLDIFQSLYNEHQMAFAYDYLNCLNNQARYYYKKKEYDNALKLLLKIEEIGKNLPSDSQELIGVKEIYLVAISNIGLVYENKGDYVNAEKYYEKALTLSTEYNEQFGDAFLPEKAVFLYRLAKFHIDDSHKEETSKYATEALEILSSLKEKGNFQYQEFSDKLKYIITQAESDEDNIIPVSQQQISDGIADFPFELLGKRDDS